MVVGVGLAPTVFLVWQIYSLLRSLLSHLTIEMGAVRHLASPQNLVGPTGLEPVTPSLKVRCSTG